MIRPDRAGQVSRFVLPPEKKAGRHLEAVAGGAVSPRRRGGIVTVWLSTVTRQTIGSAIHDSRNRSRSSRQDHPDFQDT